ncbi:MAG: transglutaminase family protein [Candidatus Rhabdochlamydia sp.]
MKILVCFFLIIGCYGHTNQLKALYNSLDPKSVMQHVAFYELYPDSKEGQAALKRAWQLLSQGTLHQQNTPLPTLDLKEIISLITRQSFEPNVMLNQEQLQLIQAIAHNLANRKKKGVSLTCKEDVLKTPSEEIDLARALLLFQSDTQNLEYIKQYETLLDLMALQILTRLCPNSSDLEKIRALNDFIFQQMQFRFPPHSLYAHDIDLYTFLPSVLDNRQGVCLGVSILYLCLAQRLDLNLNIITPPGHIYLSYPDKERVINIETTSRGIDLPSEDYLGINNRSLQKRTIKEVIGLAFINQASVFWQKDDYQQAINLYKKAQLFLPQDPLLKMFLGINYLLIGEKAKGKKILQEIRNLTFEDSVSAETIPEDYLKKRIDAEGIRAVFLSVDETRDSIIHKQETLKAVLKRFPKYRAGIFQLATTWLQLNRSMEAMQTLETYYALDPTNATVAYYLTILSLQRLDFNRAWKYWHQANRLTQERNHSPKVLKELHVHLKRLCPDPL